jgi:hypothetical protein
VNRQTGVNDMLALLEALKSIVQTFVAREEKLNSDFRVLTAAAQTALAEHSQALTTGAQAREFDAEKALAAERAHIQSRFEARKVRIARAQSSVNRQRADASSQQETQLGDRTRQAVKAAEIHRDESLAKVTAAYNQYQQDLVTSGEEVKRLEAAARSAFRGYGSFRRLLSPHHHWPEPDLTAAPDGLFSEAQRLRAEIGAQLESFEKFPLPKIFRFIPVWLSGIVLLGVAAADPVLTHLGHPMVNHVAAALAVTVFAAGAIAHYLGGRAAAPLAGSIGANLAKLRRLQEACGQKSGTLLQAEQARINAEFEAAKQNSNQEWRQSFRDLTSSRTGISGLVAEKINRVARKNEAWRQTQTAMVQERFTNASAELKAQDAARVRELSGMHQNKLAQLTEQQQRQWEELAADWTSQITPLCAQLQAANAAAEAVFPPWDAELWKNWTPPTDFQNAVKFGELKGDIEKFTDPLPKDPRLKWPGPAVISAPLSLLFPARGAILFESGKTGGEEAFVAINNIIFRLLSTTPPGKLNFTVFDPVGLGQNFSALMHLADYDDGSINSRIWTQAGQFEEKLAELNEHMEKVIQMYLRNEYATIAEYNAQAGSIAEKYHFLVIGSFPVNFSETAARRLRNIAASGARCGVFTLIHWDQRTALPPDFVPDELRANSVCLARTARGFRTGGMAGAGRPTRARSAAGAGRRHGVPAPGRREQQERQSR